METLDKVTLHSSALVKRIATQNGLNYDDCLALINSGQMELQEMISLYHEGEGWLIASRLAAFIEDCADRMDNP